MLCPSPTQAGPSYPGVSGGVLASWWQGVHFRCREELNSARERYPSSTMKRFYCLLLFSASACASPQGATWAFADFNKYQKNYADFDRTVLTIGAEKRVVLEALGLEAVPVAAGPDYEVLAIERWKVVGGPDHLMSHLFLLFRDGRLNSWKVEGGENSVGSPTPPLEWGL